MSEKKEGDDFIGNELTIYNSEYIMTTPLEKQEYIIYKMMYPGLYILAGAPKIGKSWLALDLCLSVANGEQFLKHDTNICAENACGQSENSNTCCTPHTQVL